MWSGIGRYHFGSLEALRRTYTYTNVANTFIAILYVSIVERLHFLQAAPITSAIYFSQAISARRAISAWLNELRDRWAMHPVFADRKRSSEIRSSRILEPLSRPPSQVHFLPPSLARSSSLSLFSFRPRSQSRISCHLSLSKSLSIAVV